MQPWFPQQLIGTHVYILFYNSFPPVSLSLQGAGGDILLISKDKTDSGAKIGKS